MTHPSDRELVDFVLYEARLIDRGRYEEWLELFAEDGVYWMPLAPGQTDARLHASLMHEDKLLLKIRVERLRGRYGAWGMVVASLSPIPFSLLCYFTGAYRLGRRDALIVLGMRVPRLAIFYALIALGWRR